MIITPSSDRCDILYVVWPVSIKQAEAQLARHLLRHDLLSTRDIIHRSRLFVRMNRCKEAIELLENISFDTESTLDKVAVSTLRFVADFILNKGNDRNFIESDFSDLEIPINFKSEIQYLKAFQLNYFGDHKKALSFLRDRQVTERDEISAHYFCLIAYIEIALGNYDEAYDYFKQSHSIQGFTNEGKRDADLQSRTLTGLAFCKSEINDGNGPVITQTMIELSDSCRDSEIDRSEALLYIGMAHAKRQQRQEALGVFQSIYAIDPQSSWSACALSESAEILSIANEPLSCSIYFQKSFDLALGIAWDSKSPYEHLFLLQMAITACRLKDHQKATKLIEIYDSLKHPDNPAPALRDFQRTLRSHAQSLVSSFLSPSESVSSLTDIFYQWRSMGLKGRAFNAADDADNLRYSPLLKTRVSDEHAASLQKQDLSHEGSEFSEGLHQQEHNKQTIERMTSTMKKVLILAVFGKTAVTIGKELGLNTKSVRNNLSRLYFEFAVSSHAALVSTVLLNSDLRKYLDIQIS